MGVRIAKIGKHPVSEKFGKVSVETRYHSRANTLIDAHDCLHLFGIDLSRKLCRTHKVAEHQGQLAALVLGIVGRGARLCLGRRNLDDCPPKLRDRLQQFHPWPERYAQSLEM